MDILEELSAARRADARENEKRIPFQALEKRIASLPPTRDFRAAFVPGRVNVIAEVKKASPSEGVIREDFDPEAIVRAYDANGAAALSILCEPHRFLGSEEYLRRARGLTELPLLYKDFLTTEYQLLAARAAGADACLLIAATLDDRALSRLLRFAGSISLVALVETHTADEIRRALDVGAEIVGVNCRDLRTFRTDPAITAELVAQLPATVLKIAESGIRNRADIAKLREAGADGFLIGTALMRAENPGEKLKEIMQ